MLVAIAVLALGALPALLVLPHDEIAIDANLPLLAWLPIGVVGVLRLDARPRSALGWCAVAVAAGTPFAMMLTALPVPEPEISTGPAWLLTLGVLVMAALPAPGRSARRWRFWIISSCVATVVAGSVAWQTAATTTYGGVAALGLLTVASVLAMASVGGPPRPVIEPLVDAALIVAVCLVGAAVGAVLWSFARHERVFGADAIGVFAAALTVVMAVPAALSVRRAFIARRYGAGVIAPDDLSALGADFDALADPRQLLAAASALVTAASGVAESQIVLAEPDDHDDRPAWTTYPLQHGGEQIGVLSVRPRDVEGLESRQDLLVRQLVPTVAMLARAVILAVAADHARADLARQRDAERERILADLHDDLGPTLAGMSMRVQAVRAAPTTADLDALAGDLALCRADLRRTVSALTPAPLAQADLDTALTALTDSFRFEGGPRVGVRMTSAGDVTGEQAVLIYRFVAEALTNAVRHADAGRIEVCVERVLGVEGAPFPGVIRASVEDDGRGGPVVPGVGLTSLRARAEEAQGRLDVCQAAGRGVRVVLALPSPSGAVEML